MANHWKTRVFAFVMLALVGCASNVAGVPDELTNCVRQPSNWCSYFSNNNQYLCPNYVSTSMPSDCLQLASVLPDANGSMVWCCGMHPMCRYSGFSPPCAEPNTEHQQVGYDCVLGATPTGNNCAVHNKLSNDESVYCCDSN